MDENRRYREKGQSLVLVAAAMVALVMFVAVAVDLGNAYYARRTAQNAADGAALAGASRLATGINNEAKLDGAIKEDMNDFAERNGIADTNTAKADVNDNVEGWYVDTSGNRLPDWPMVGDGTVPEGAYGVEAITHITATAFFGGIFGVDGYPLQARAVSQIRLACGSDCVVPITTDVDLFLDSGGDPRNTCFHIWQERVKDDEDISSGVLGWVNWTWQESVSECGDTTSECSDGRPCPPPQGPGCQTGALEANLNPNTCGQGYVQVGDWISSATGDMNSSGVRCWLSYYAGYGDPDASDCADGVPHSFTIPVYDYSTADLEGGSSTPCLTMKDPCDYTTGGLHYHVVGFARVQVLQYELSAGLEVPPDDALDPDTLAYIDSCTDYYDFDCDPTAVDYEDCIAEKREKEGFRITVEFFEYVQDFSSSNECYDPFGTLWSSPKLTE